MAAESSDAALESLVGTLVGQIRGSEWLSQQEPTGQRLWGGDEDPAAAAAEETATTKKDEGGAAAKAESGGEQSLDALVGSLITQIDSNWLQQQKPTGVRLWGEDDKKEGATAAPAASAAGDLPGETAATESASTDATPDPGLAGILASLEVLTAPSASASASAASASASAAAPAPPLPPPPKQSDVKLEDMGLTNSQLEMLKMLEKAVGEK